MAIESEFYKDLSKIEKKYFKFTKRQFKAYLALSGATAVVFAESFFLPEWAFYLVTVPTALILSAYPVALLTDNWRVWKRKVQLKFQFEDNYYRSNQIRRYSKDEFISKDEIQKG